MALRGWAAPPPVHPGYRPGAYYGPEVNATVGATAVAPNTLYAHPIVIRSPVTPDRLAMRINTGAAGLAKMGIYSHDAAAVAPAALVAECAADVDTTAGAASVEAGFAANPTLAPGVYWMASVFSAAPSPFTVSNGQTSMVWLFGANAFQTIATSGGNAYSRATVPLAYVSGQPFLPAAFGTPTFAIGLPGAPLVGFRAA